MSSETELAGQAKAWPFEEAKKLVARLGGKPPAKGYVLFETGYGPSGLPHIGTFGEVVRTTFVGPAFPPPAPGSGPSGLPPTATSGVGVRTTFVRQAFQRLAPDVPTRLFAFSDDMDGLRKVPDNIPNRDMVTQHLHKPLTKVPDPFGKFESFGHHNNAMLRGFLDSFGFEYEFQSASDWYRSGRFDQALLKVLQHYDEIMAVMLPTLGEERQQSYSPFLPISPKTGRVLQVPILERNATAGTIVFADEDGARTEVPVTGGHTKLQWKPDWGMRHFALGVDYEMSGKDLIPSVDLASKIVKILGGRPPEGFNYELFLDEQGQKISKSKGNGLTVEEWLRYAPPESLALYMFQKPRAAKRLYFDVIPRAVDEYLSFVDAFGREEAGKRLENPAWHIHNGSIPAAIGTGTRIPYILLLNLAAAANAENKDVMWGFIRRYQPGATPENSPYLAILVERAVAYYQDQIKPTKKFRAPSEVERAALGELRAALAGMGADATAEALQTEIYEIGKRHPFGELKAWFSCLYEVLLGQQTGPRMGSFVALYGRAETIQLIDEKLAA